MKWININEHLSITKYPITVSEYKLFIDKKGYSTKKYWSKNGWQWKEQNKVSKPAYWLDKQYNKKDYPITGISFWEAEAFANYSNAKLPNELIWEYVATNKGKTNYPWGNDKNNIEKKAQLSFFGKFSKIGLTSVKAHKQGDSNFGVSDLIGNVSEWCIPKDKIKLSIKDDIAVLRGGSHWHIPDAVNSYFSSPTYLTTRDNQTGIRLVKWDILNLNYKLKNNDSNVKISSPVGRPTKPFRQEGQPKINSNIYKLKIKGLVKNPVELSLKDLQTKFSIVEQKGLFVCVCNWADNNVVKGVLLKDIINFVKPKIPLNKLYIKQKSIPGLEHKIYETTISAKKAIANNTILCFEINNKPLTLELGYPIRLIDFKIYGYKQVKALEVLEFTDKFELGWWEKDKGYDSKGKIQKGNVTVIGNKPYRTKLK